VCTNSLQRDKDHGIVVRTSCTDGEICVWHVVASSVDSTTQAKSSASTIGILSSTRNALRESFPRSKSANACFDCTCAAVGTLERDEIIELPKAHLLELRRLNIRSPPLRTHSQRHVLIFQARGYSDGSIQVRGLPTSAHSRDLLISGHNEDDGSSSSKRTDASAAIRCVAFGRTTWQSERPQTPTKDEGEKVVATTTLLSGDTNGRVTIRRLRIHMSHSTSFLRLSVDKTSERSFVDAHFSAVTRFFVEPRASRRSSPSKNEEYMVCSIGQDADIALYLISGSRVDVLHYFRGHESPILNVRWRLNMRLLFAVCADGAAWAWSVSTGILERIVSARGLFGARTETNDIAFKNLDSVWDGDSAAVRLCPLPMGSRSVRSPPAHVMLMHMRRAAFMVKCDALRRKGREAYVRKTRKLSASSSSEASASSPSSSSPPAASSSSRPLFSRHPNLSFLMSWGVDKDLDALCERELGVVRPPDSCAFGFHGVGGAVTALLPSACGGKSRWSYSSDLTALHSLALVAVFMTPLKCKLQQGLFSKLITNYGVIFPEILSCYKDASLSMLGRCGLSSWEEGHVAARLLLQCTIERMDPHIRLQSAAQWAARLHREPTHFDTDVASTGGKSPRTKRPVKVPTSPTKVSEVGPTVSYASSEPPSGAATRSRRVEKGKHRHTTPPSSPSRCTSSLSEKTADEGSEPSLQPAISIHVMRSIKSADADTGAASSSIADRRRRRRHHLKPAGEEVIALILSVIAVAHPDEIAQQTAQRIAVILCGFLWSDNVVRSAFAAEILGKGFPLWRPYIGNLKGLIQRLLVLTIPRDSRTWSASGGASVIAAAQRALMEVGHRESLVFVHTTGAEILRPDVGSRHRCTALLALVALVNKHPSSLIRHLPTVVEAVIRSLDPSEPELRKGCLKASSRALHELVKRFPMVAFHQPSQRYAVGTTSSAIVVYDLRTATKWRILSGHTRSVSAVAFAEGGDVIASYSSQESCVKAWRSGSSGVLGGILGIQGDCIRTVPLPKFPQSQPKADTLGNCGIRWTSNQTVELRREDGKRVNLKLL